MFFYDDPVSDLATSSVRPASLLRHGNLVGDIHTHSRMEKNSPGFLEHSHADTDAADDLGVPGYMVNPAGELVVYQPNSDQYRKRVVATGLPYDEAFYDNSKRSRRLPRHRKRRQWQNKYHGAVARLKRKARSARRNQSAADRNRRWKVGARVTPRRD